MSLLDALRADPLIMPFLKDTCAEGGMAATVSSDIAPEDIVIISPDGYYNSLRQNRPKSPDCLVVVRCGTGEFQVWVVELRDINSSKGFKPTEIRDKFLTCLNDFMRGVLSAHFNREDVVFRQPRLLFVSDPLGQRQGKGREHIRRLNQPLRMDALLTLPWIQFDKYFLHIESHVNDPLITPC